MNMKNIFVGLLLLAAISAFSFETLAQRTSISRKEFFDGTTKQSSKVYERSRRIITTDETILAGVTTKTVMSISDYLVPDRSHEYSKITAGDKVSETEQINIDYMQYDRKDGGAWTKLDLRQNGYGYGMGSGSGAGLSTQCDQFSVEPTFLNGMSMQFFDWISIDGSGKELTFKESKEWIGDDGFPYKKEETKGKLFPRDETHQTVTTYTYDPNIKIEAPIK